MKKFIILTISLLVGLPALTQAQNVLWSRTYGGSNSDGSYSAQQTSDGGYIMAGYTESFGASSNDVYLIKTDSLGDTLWSRTYGGNDTDYGYSVQQTSDGGYIVAGHTNSFGAGGWDVYLIKTDSLGEALWTRTYGGDFEDEVYSVQQTSDGGCIVAGHTNSFGAGGWDVYLIKSDSLGDTLWTRTYGGSRTDAAYSIQQTTDGGYIVAGYTESFGAGASDVYLIKTNSLGDTLWTRTYGGSDYDYGRSVQQTSDSGYMVAGYTYSFGAGAMDFYLIKTDSFGDTLWTRTYGGSDDDYGCSVQQTSDEGYVVAGISNSFGDSLYDVYLIKTDSLSDTLWTRTYGGSAIDYGYSVQQTSDGEYIVSGCTESFGSGGRNLMLTKLDSSGNSCFGEFITSTVTSPPCSITGAPTVVTLPATLVTSPTTEVKSPPTQVTTVCDAICGDASGDVKVDIIDAVYLVLYLFRSGDPPQCSPESYFYCADVNGDEEATIADVVYLINYLLKSGPPPIF